MKKIVSIWLLLFFALGLCACSEASAGIAEAWESGMNGTGSLVVTTEKEEPAVVIPPTAIRLNVTFGPEFDVVMTNPPIRAGKAVIYKMFEDAKEHLVPGGALYLVIRKQQGAPSALKFLKELYGKAEVIERDGGYWIIECIKA